MYELIDIINYDATRLLKLRNIDTGLIEECFDDSAVVSNNNFDFMQIGQVYDCKIKLFGKVLPQKTSDSSVAIVVSRDVMIGQRPMVEILINGSKYYLPRHKLGMCLNNNIINLMFTRKDLVQVNNILHADFL